MQANHPNLQNHPQAAPKIGDSRCGILDRRRTSITKTQHDPLADFTPIEEFSLKQDGKLKPSQIRWMSRFRHTNGLSACGAIVIVSRKMYIHEGKFSEWFAQQTG